MIDFFAVQAFGQADQLWVVGVEFLHGLGRNADEELVVFFGNEVEAQPVFEHDDFRHAMLSLLDVGQHGHLAG